MKALERDEIFGSRSGKFFDDFASGAGPNDEKVQMMVVFTHFKRKINYVLWSLIYLTSKCTFRLYIFFWQRQQQQLKMNILIVKSEVYFFKGP